MAKDFPDSGYAYHPPATAEDIPAAVGKFVPAVPASQSERPQLRPVLKPLED